MVILHVVGRIKNELLQSPNAVIIWFHIYSLTFTDFLPTLRLEERLIGRKRAHIHEDQVREYIGILKTRACICNKLFLCK